MVYPVKVMADTLIKKDNATSEIVIYRESKN